MSSIGTPWAIRLRGVQECEPVEGPLGAGFLRDTDQGVGDEHDAEQGVLRLAYHQDHDEEGGEYEVETGQQIRPQDLGHRTTGSFRAGVGLATGLPLCHLSISQPGIR
jgi:hypothetical protein